MRRAAFLDRDGVLNVDTGYPHRPDQILWQEGATAAVRLLNEAGYLVIVVSNQSGVARGLFGEAEVAALHRWMAAELEARGAHVDGWYICPYHNDAVLEAYRHPDHPDRKPNPGMLLKAAAEHGIALESSLLIGDRPSDLQAARAAGVVGHLFAGGDLSAFVAALLGDPASPGDGSSPAPRARR